MIARPMFRSIVVGTDGSDTARQAVREAVELAAAVGATIELVSAYEPGRREAGEATLREAAAGAEAAGVPVRSDPALVQALASLELGREIPEELYLAVAEVLAWAYRLDGEARGTS
jgi:type III secretion system FlhB-like substrate exporter